jgi:hypothetical protein
VTEGVARLDDPLERDWAAAQGNFGSLENGDGGVVVRLAEVKADEVAGADRNRSVTVGALIVAVVTGTVE